jgi:acetyl esterase
MTVVLPRDLGALSSDDTDRVKRPWLVPAIVLVVSGSVLAAVPAGAADTPVPDSPVKVTNDIVYRGVGREKIALDAYVPTATTTKRPVIVLVHGGAWRGGDKSNFVGDGMKLAALGYVAFSVNYRLTPQYPYPAAVNDVEAAVRWVRAAAQVKRYAIDPTRVGAIGSSAGGHLVGMLATLGHGSLAKRARINAAVSWSGPMDFRLWPLAALSATSLGTDVLSFLDCPPGVTNCPNVVAASPISHIDKTDAPMLLANSENELVGLNHATTMDAALQAAGVTEQLVVFPGGRHAQEFADDIWPQTIAFLEQYVGKPPAVQS